MGELIFSLWVLCNILLLIHIVHEFILMGHAVSRRTKVKPVSNPSRLPYVTIQLPLFNEKYVVERLLEAVSKMDYPQDLLEVQILDDSNDETSEIITSFLQKSGFDSFDFKHIQRKDRVGFKAGALEYGMKSTTGEFIAIFDADFVPDPQFLMQTLGHFEDQNVACVQTRWTHINQDFSILTRAQKIML
ncbi:MAG: glycosyltransferase, partial [Saprospiraceae bacterium]|nr:glycosyltransferase [Saprospiraceae bacterium]